ncbi:MULTISPECIES: DUF86 domain-containing protein [unclassified Lebetimonas]|uniref:HepT-like ribonuclease domain-containing protein n=1 Tax=unclassified Lebetimonas TaxID=2648158 RepID=UPI000467A3F8|nr:MULTISPECIES: DUF86 domain-containing protein [unclassified Lebetimonas]
MHRDKSLFLDDILESVNAIESYVVYIDFDEFKNDRKTYQAVIREFEIIGEATKNIYQDLKKVYPNYDWRKIIDFRNIVSHNYFGIDFLTIWNTIFDKLPELKQIIEKILKEGLE